MHSAPISTSGCAHAGSRLFALILVQVGNKRTMRRGLRRLAVNNKYWPNERWARGAAPGARYDALITRSCCWAPGPNTR